MTQHKLYRSLAAALWLFSSNCMAYANLFPPLKGTKATTVLDIPGCACQGRWCKEEEKYPMFFDSYEEMNHVAMHPLSGSKAGHSDVVSPKPICDAPEASNEFRHRAGDLANPVDVRFAGSFFGVRGYWYEVGITLIRVESGNCDTAYQRQQKCSMEPSSYFSTGLWYSWYPYGCAFRSFRLPTTNATLVVAPSCLSNFQEEVDIPHDDRFSLYASWQKDDEHDTDFCRTDIDNVLTATDTEDLTAKLKARTIGLLQNRSSYPHFPIMGHEDWIEPVEGFRYMGYDFVDDQEEANEYCLSVFSLGCESCNGCPEEASSSVNSSPSSFVPILLVFGVLATFGIWRLGNAHLS